MGVFGYESNRVDELKTLLRAVRNSDPVEYHDTTGNGYRTLAVFDYGHLPMYASIFSDGTCMIESHVVSKELLNDFVSFLFSIYIDNTGRRLWQESYLIGENTPVLSSYLNGIKGEAENLTVGTLSELLNKGLEIGDFAGYNCEVIIKSGYKEESLVDARLLFPVYENGTLKGFVLYGIGRRNYEEQTYYINEVLLLDSSLHYVSDLLRENLPEGDWTIKNGIELPEYTPVYRQ